MTTRIIRVAVPVPVADCFDYLWEGAAPPAPGSRVVVPFGRGKRIGVVIEWAAGTKLPADKLKRVVEPLDAEPLVAPELMSTLRFAAEYYHHPIGEVFSHALPGLLRKGRAAEPAPDPMWELTPSGAMQPVDAVGAKAPRQGKALSLLAAGPVPVPALRRAGVTTDALRRLEGKGWIRAALCGAPPGGILRSPSARPADGSEPTARVGPEPEDAPELTAEQARVLDEMARHPGGYAAFLLHGVTGSGKTEVFLRLIADQLRAGRQTLLLVPEIGLTPQLVARLDRRFGAELAIMHSGLTETERLAAWRKAKSGAAGVVVGTRSAVFSQLARPGLVVVDEEHDASFKQQQGFRYSARDLAVLRARRLDVPVLLASATPSLESYHNAATGRYQLLKMPSRVGSAGEPEVRLVDLTKHATRQSLSTPLLERMERHLGRGDQVLLFLNRRGFAPVLFCAPCRHAEECKRCDARMTVHAAQGELRCHHCGAVKALTWGCPSCGAERIAVGSGTERVTDELRALFPGARIGRLDRDATARKGALDAVLADVVRGDTRILVGTQMLTKGHDFPRVTLVGVLNADQGLFGTDLRSDERLAQTIVQVAGRAGRRDTRGEVVIQTHYPDHPLLTCLLEQGYDAFARLALAERHRSGWPPYSHLAIWRAEATRRPAVFEFLDRLNAAGWRAGAAVKILGPAPDPMERKGGRFRGRLLLQSTERPSLHALLDRLLRDVRDWPEARRVRWAVDVDPLDV